MSIINRLFAAAAIGAAFISAPAFAGPIIIAGTDADDHGSFNGTANVSGWEFMELAVERITGAVSNGNTTFVCIGCNGSSASAAFNSAFNLATKPAGWTSVSLTSNADITAFFNGTGTTNINNAGAIYMPTVANNVTGGITDAQLGIVNGRGSEINNFVAAGGGLFTQEQVNSTIGYGWLTSLLPSLGFHGDNDGFDFSSGTLNLTAEGNAQFPGLTDSEISSATPWHAFFTGNIGALQVLVTGPADANLDGRRAQGEIAPVVIGGGFTGGGGGVIVCGQPGAPACPDPTDVPAPAGLPLLGAALAGLVALRRRA